jgi:IS1 family transposase
MSFETAQSYREAFDWIEKRVKPQRQTNNNKTLRERWWQFERPRCELYRKLRPLKCCIVCAATTKHLCFSVVAQNYIFSHALKIFTTDRWDLFSVVQSTLHEVWARKYSGALETRLRYSPTDCFETFAFPKGLWEEADGGLAEIGERYHEHRRQMMHRLWLGLTDVYNLFHSEQLEANLEKHFGSRAKKDPEGFLIPEEHRAAARAFTMDEAITGIQELRRLHTQLDYTVLKRYGRDLSGQDGPAIDLGHGFYDVETLPENDRRRYTISPTARRELLTRLLAENHRRAAETPPLQSTTPPKEPTEENLESSVTTKSSHRSNKLGTDPKPLTPTRRSKRKFSSTPELPGIEE